MHYYWWRKCKTLKDTIFHAVPCLCDLQRIPLQRVKDFFVHRGRQVTSLSGYYINTSGFLLNEDYWNNIPSTFLLAISNSALKASVFIIISQYTLLIFPYYAFSNSTKPNIIYVYRQIVSCICSEILFNLIRCHWRLSFLALLF